MIVLYFFYFVTCHVALVSYVSTYKNSEKTPRCFSFKQ